jgi:hypothetical protein
MKLLQIFCFEILKEIEKQKGKKQQQAPLSRVPQV